MAKRNTLKAVAVLIAVIGSAISLYFMFNAGRNQKSILLIVLFTGWVLSPSFGMMAALRLFTDNKTQNLIYRLLIVLSIASVIAYSGLAIPLGTKPAFIFLAWPLTCWITILISIWIVRRNLPEP